MSILGYSTSYFLPEYWGSTPLYGEKIIPLLDYILSTEYTQADGLANAFYMMENKYKGTANLPIEAIEEIIDESGYGYVKALLGNDEDSIRLLVYLLVLIHQLKGTKLGLEVVLNLLKKKNNDLVFGQIGNPVVDTHTKEVSGFTISDYIKYNNFTVDDSTFNISLKFRTGRSFGEEQCILSSENYGLYIGINSEGYLILCLGSNRTSWNILDSGTSPKPLKPSTIYYVKLVYDGYSYKLKLSEDGKKYEDVISKDSITPINVHKGTLYLGVDGSSGGIQNPFSGAIDLLPTSLEISNTEIIQWFEEFKVGDEDTFIIKTDLDIAKLSPEFFENFSNFVSKYVYPTLTGMEVRMSLENNLTVIPYSRQKIKYVAETSYLIIDPLTVTPLTTSQELIPPPGIDGYSPITVNAVTADVDENIIPVNIKSGVTILGVEGTCEELNAESRTVPLTSTSGNTFTPSSQKNAFSSITVTPNNESRTVTPSTSQQVLNVNTGYAGNGSITVEAVTSSIDSNITSANIKNGVNILGVTGNCEELNAEVAEKTLTSTSQIFTPSNGRNAFSSITVTPNNENRTVTPSTSQQVLNVNTGYAGNGTITLNPVTASVDSNIQAGNIKSGVSILGVTGTLGGGTGVTNVNDNYIVRTNGDIELLTKGSYTLGAKDTSVTDSLKNAYLSSTTVKEVHIGKVTDLSLEQVMGDTFDNCTNLVNADLSGLTTVSGNFALYEAFRGCTNLTSVNLSGLTTVSGNSALSNAFNGCTGLLSANLSSLTATNGSYSLNKAFYNCINLTGLLDLSSLTTISGSSALNQAFEGCTSLTSVDLSSLRTLDGSNGLTNAFNGCTSITSVDLSNLVSINGYAGLNCGFRNCSALESVDLSSLTTVTGKNGLALAFDNCTNLISADLSSLTTISDGGSLSAAFNQCMSLANLNLSSLSSVTTDSGLSLAFKFCTSLVSIDLGNLSIIRGNQIMYEAFYRCSNLSSIDLSSLSVIDGSEVLRSAFSRCTSLASLSFPALTSTSFGSYTNQFYSMLSGVTGCTVHFPSNLQSVIGSWTSVVAGFDGTNTVVLFDLPATS